jgi:methylmalonyl-CoA/ethylmalonyl-CoA epimerase
MVLKQLDHVAILVRDTEDALGYFRDRLGLDVVHVEDNEPGQARLTYLDAGGALIQLVQPLNEQAPLWPDLVERGEGLHHICFGVDDVSAAANTLADFDVPLKLGSGRGRRSAFIPGNTHHGVLVELTEATLPVPRTSESPGGPASADS